METSFSKYLSNTIHIKPEHLPILTEKVARKQLGKSEILLTEGQVCKNIYFVETGLLRLYSLDQNGKEHIIQFAPENWWISERGSLYFGTPSGFFIDALEKTGVVVLNQEFTDMASDISHEFRTYNEYLLQNHIRQLQNRINMLIATDAETRYLDFIHLYPDLTLRIPQWMIASYLGITPESLSRVRKGLAGKQ